MKKKLSFFTLRRKFTLGFVLVALILSATICVVTARTYRESLISQYSWSAFGLARTIAHTLDGDMVDDYLAAGMDDNAFRDAYITAMAKLRAAFALDGDIVEDYFAIGVVDEAYRAAYDYMKDTMSIEHVEYVYVLVPGADGYRYVWNVPKEGEEHTPIGYYEEYWNEGDKMALESMDKGVNTPNILVTDSAEYGYIASAYVPIFDASGRASALVGVDISMEDITRQINDYILRTALITVGIVFVMVLAYMLYLRRTLIRPLLVLTRAAGDFARSDESIEYTSAAIRTGDEIQALSESFDKMAEDIRRFVQNLTAVTAERERIATELNVATTIQNSMLPQIFPPFPHRSEFDLFASMNPAKEVGGDFYDFYMVDDDHIALIIADVSGKGVPAALFMVIAKTLIKNHAQSGATPTEVFTITNNQLCESNDAEMFVTAFMALVNVKTGEVTFANAGHNHPVIRRADGECAWLKSRPGFVLAGMENIKFRVNEMRLNPGDALLLYTDGVTEALNPKRELYSDRRLIDFMADSARAGSSAREIGAALVNDVTEFADGAEQADDITILVFRFFGEQPRS